MSNIERNTEKIKREALRLGFESIGISKAGFLEEDAPRLEQWLKKGYHGQMNYMENHFEKRLNPQLLVEGAKSVISLSYNYYPEKKQIEDSFKISNYALGEDYHHVIKDKLKIFLNYISEEIGEINGRAFVDSAPVMERSWAKKSGLGWVGKHSLLIQKSKGSYYFLAQLILDLELDYDQEFSTDHCGSCTRCIDACPTAAILPQSTIDSSKCISYLTIELKTAIPESFKGQFNDWMFGCDICQEVCPWNRFSRPTKEPLFDAQDKLLKMKKSEWVELSEDLFTELFRKSAVKRTKFTGLKRNIHFLTSNSKI